MTGLQKLEAVKMRLDRMAWAERLLEEKSARAESTTYRMNEVKVQSNTVTNWNEEAILQVITARECYTDAVNDYVEALSEAYNVLYSLPDPKWLEILSGRYIKDLSWQQIADDTGQSSRNCMVLHKKALKWLEENAGN